MRRIAIVSGYFNPPHIGHYKMIEEASKIGRVYVIVNNDQQQKIKKKKIIRVEDDRYYMIKKNKDVWKAMISIDEDQTVKKSLAHLARLYPDDQLVFCNGGDRGKDNIPETKTCEAYGIGMVFGVGGDTKQDASSTINKELGLEE